MTALPLSSLRGYPLGSVTGQADRTLSHIGQLMPVSLALIQVLSWCSCPSVVEQKP